MSHDPSSRPLPEPLDSDPRPPCPGDPAAAAQPGPEHHDSAPPPDHDPPDPTPLPGPDTPAPSLSGLAAWGLGPRANCRRPRGKRLVQPQDTPPALTPEQRLLLLDTWQRSGLPAGDFAALVGLSKHTLYSWKHKFDTLGPAGLMDQPRGGPSGSKLSELTKRTILLLKQNNPEFGCQKISDLLLRGPALPASPAAVARVLHEAGYQLEEVTTRPHPDHVRSFERAHANQLWQTDLFTFVLETPSQCPSLPASFG